MKNEKKHFSYIKKVVNVAKDDRMVGDGVLIFTRKYTARIIHARLHRGPLWRVFHILTIVIRAHSQ